MGTDRKQQTMVLDKTANLANYEEAITLINWKEIEKSFSWNETDKVNMAYEAIDRHVDQGYGDRVALLYTDGKRDEKYTYSQLRQLSCQVPF